MKKFFLFAFLLTLACFMALPVQAADDGNEFVIDGFRMDTQPGGYFFTNVIENLAPGAVALTEESGGYGLFDRPRVYFEGDSWTQFRWRYAGHDIGSALDDGAPALQIPLLALGSMALRGETPAAREYGFHFVPPAAARDGETRTRIMLSTAFSDLGGWSAMGKWIVGNHASLRADDLYATRRRFDGNVQLDFALEKGRGFSSLLLAGGYAAAERRWNDFNVLDAQFSEESRRLSLLGRWQRRFAAGVLDVDLVLNSGNRGNLFAETGRLPQETYNQDALSCLAGATWTGRTLTGSFTWLHERQELQPFAVDAAKDLKDIDGQAFFPFDRQGEFSADTLRLAFERELRFDLLGREARLRPYLDLSAAFTRANETSGVHNAILFSGQPYLVHLWPGGDASYRHDRSTATAGSLLRADLGGRFDLEAKVFLQHQRLGFPGGGDALGFLQMGGEVGLGFQAGRRTRISLSFGDLPYELGAGVSDFLETRRPSAEVRYWRDGNRDGLFQEGEQGALYALSGGASHSAAADLKPSRRQRLELLFTAPLSRRFQLDLKGLYKRILRPLWVSYAGEYGQYEEIGGTDYYILDRPVTAYELGNASFARDPFYAEFLLRIHGERERRWYFSFSFMAHMGMGNTAFGNGPEANDIGVISESQASPNSWINGFGRVDGDRAFVGRIHFGYYLARRLFLGGSVKYRDGNPFAFLDAVQRDGQWLITYHTIQAEDEHSRKGGPREDCVWDFNFKLGYDLTLFGKKGRLEISLFNLLDFGGELSENAFSNDIDRLANELQLPRSLRLGLVLEL
ncbi:MAG: hypothetical protein JXO51_11280 [Candidatus Aminicenantes bacterium]|nr:hypothetical protein [Candidatus Aminicenantes bacterium]